MRFSLFGLYRTLNTVYVSAAALRHNLTLYRQLLPGQAICPVLKANAYGHGLALVARILDREKPEFLIVDSLYEAYELQKAGIRTKILILGYTLPENLEGRGLPFHFAVSDLDSAEILARQGAQLHLKIDTGMNRMGFLVDELPAVLLKLRTWKADVVGVCTHLADADNPVNDDYTEFQLGRFEQAIVLVRKAGFTPKWIHPGQSAGALKAAFFGASNMVRLGLALYGISPFEDSSPAGEPLKSLMPVMQVESTLVGLRHLKKGDRVSYNGIFVAPRDMTIGVVPFGYYEGLPRALNHRGVLQVKGVACPIVGRVCMNYTMVDISNVPKPVLGDVVVVISRESGAPNSIIELAKCANTIPYELMVRVAASVRREVV